MVPGNKEGFLPLQEFYKRANTESTRAGLLGSEMYTNPDNQEAGVRVTANIATDSHLHLQIYGVKNGLTDESDPLLHIGVKVGQYGVQKAQYVNVWRDGQNGEKYKAAYKFQPDKVPNTALSSLEMVHPQDPFQPIQEVS